ncbi:MAG: hypothetical protein SF002_04775 [Alphaproteobacteria bacterium]|nr:hypothetical protein [Alphaproteobacteria bacterium]
MISRVRFLGLAASFLLSAVVAAPAAAQGQQDFTLINRTGYQIDEVYVSRPTAKTWGRDILGDGVLANGASKAIRFAAGTQGCQWDIMVKFDDGSEVEWDQPFNLCEISRLTLRYNRSTGVTSAVWE